jgi:N-acetylglucosaminyl-diphospho-decaprenol L-rhamnosyltransferase
MTPALDIIVVNFNTRDDLLACLGSIATYPPSVAHQVVVVDNGSTDGSVDAIRARPPRVKLIELPRNIGFGAANNVAFRGSAAPLVLLLNSDTLVTRGALDSLMARLNHTGAVAAGPRLVDATGRPEISYGSMLSPLSELIQVFRQRSAASANAIARRYVSHLVSREREVDWVSGACLLVSREAASEVGLFDERYFLYEEDVDLCAALRARGGRILFTPLAEVVHLRGRSRGAISDRSLAEYDRSHLAFYEKHAPGWEPLLRLWLKLRGRGTMRDKLHTGGDPAP